MIDPERVVICEGYDDRAFWKGWLTSLGRVDARDSATGIALAPDGKRVSQGHFAYRSPK